MNRESPAITVVVSASPNRREHLFKTLHSISQAEHYDIETVIIDYSSGTPTVERSTEIQKEFPFTCYYTLDSRNLSEVWNFGIRKSRAPLILFVMEGSILHPGCIKEHQQQHQQPDVGAVAGRIRLMRNDIPRNNAPQVSQVDDQTGELIADFDCSEEQDLIFMLSDNISIKRRVLQKTALFNPHIHGTSPLIAVEFSYRLRKHGFRIRYTPSAILYSLEGEGLGLFDKKTTNAPLHIDKLVNHTLFYLLHFSGIPEVNFFRYLFDEAQKSFSGQRGIISTSRCTICIFMVLLKAYRSFYTVIP